MHGAVSCFNRLLWSLWPLVLAVLLCLPAGLVSAQIPSEAAVKARMVLSLARFVQWPSAETGESGVLRLCVAARQAEVSGAFAALAGQVIAGRVVQVQLLPLQAASPEGANCQVLFIHSSAERAVDVLAQTVRSATLTVGDAEGFLNRGGMVELMLVNDAIRFDIQLRTLRAAQLGMSSQVLRLARQVRE
jgi:YfiR/HmsC-like